MARRGQVDVNHSQIFHVVSRVVGKEKVFKKPEKTMFVNMMRDFEAFSGVEVLCYCVMGNHFHLMLHVPVKPDSISDEEVWERMKHIYTEERMDEYREEVRQKVASGIEDYEKQHLDKMRARMFSLSMYVKDVKQKFTMWFNRRHDRKGTLWEERFKSLLVEGNSNAMMKLAAYIELNPVRAGIVKNVKDYHWCSYTEAVAGNETARKGIIRVIGGLASQRSWEEIELIYRQYFVFLSSEQNTKQKPMTTAEAMRIKIRYFTQGYILGSKEFIEQHFKKKRHTISPGRKKICNKIPGDHWDGLHSFRNVP